MMSWSATDSELQQAASYFAGVCADFVAENPGICTNIPPSITLSPIAVPTNNNVVDGGKTDAPQPVEMPVTSVQVVQTVTVTEAGTQATSTVTNMITVPQVQFVTSTPTPTADAQGGNDVAPAPTPAVALIAAQTPAAVLTTVPEPGVTPVPSNTFTFRAGASASASGTDSVATPEIFTGAANKAEIGFGLVAGILGFIAFVV